MAAPPDSWRPDWAAIAAQIVERTLQIQPGERVVYLADPGECPDLFDEVRAAVLRRGGIEQATMLAWSRRLAEQRTGGGRKLDAEVERRERAAHLELVNTADVFMWLPTSFDWPDAVSLWESEWMLARWRGRGIHCHWFPDAGSPPGHPVHRELERVYERAIVGLDYAAIAARQRHLVDAIRGRTIRVTTPEGTDLTLECPADGWYCRNDGDQSRARAAAATSARDREEELPCGAVRLIPSENSARGVITLKGGISGHTWNWNGTGLALTKLGDDLAIVFADGRVSELRSRTHQPELDRLRGGLRGDWDRVGEIVFGTNPLLETPKDAKMPAYWAFGDGGFRIHLGHNWESGGHYDSDLYINLFLMRTTIAIEGGETIVRDGRLLVS
jgi:leucyl aminopeptidase (aminopeptidase T)